MPRGSAPGERRGGRQKGTPNKKTQDLQALLEKIGVTPGELMGRIAKGEAIEALHVLDREAGITDKKRKVYPTVDQMQSADKELCRYIYPQRKAIEHSPGEGVAKFTMDLSGAGDKEEK